MRFNIKKISAIGMSVLMAGMTAGLAAAANYPAPFVSGSVADVAIVYGTGSGVSSLDAVEAANIQGDLGVFMPLVTTGDDVFPLGKESDKFHFGSDLNSVYTDLDDNEMPSFLADGDYNDGTIDSEFSQKITLGTQALELFAEDDYDEDETPTIGFYFDGDKVLDYKMTLDDDDEDFDELISTNLPLMGREYYVLEANDDDLVLSDSAEKNIITEGETITIDGKTVSIAYIDSNSAKFLVDEETTDKLADSGADYEKYYELDDGSYLVFDENLYADKESGISKAEISIGKSKITLSNDGHRVEINDEKIDGLTSFVYDEDGAVVDDAAADTFQSIKIVWETDGEEFLVEGKSMVMPGFETIQLIFSGIAFPSEFEDISIENGETVTLKMENFEVDLMYTSTATADTTTLATQGSEDNYLVISDDDAAKTQTYYLAEKDRFLATALNEDLDKVDQLYYEVDEVGKDLTDDEYTLKLSDKTDGDEDISIEDEAIVDAEDDSRDDVTITVNEFFRVGLLVVADAEGPAADGTINVTDATAAAIPARHWTISLDNSPDANDILLNDVMKFTVVHKKDMVFDKVVSKTGLIVKLPEAATDLSGDAGLVSFWEADEDGDLDDVADAAHFTTNIDWSEDNDLYADGVDGIVTVEESSDKKVGYEIGALATKVMTDSDAKTFKLEYYGEEVVADVSIASADAVAISGELGGILIKDTEVSSVSTKNLIIVGGSCINSAAAALVGGAYCGPSWTTATGVGSGQFLIKSYASSSITSKMALLVAGYEAADTTNAATYLRTQDVDTSKEYLGTSSTSAELVVVE